MNRNKELAKNTAILFIGTICTKMISFLLLPLYTKILSTGEYGTFDLLTTIASLLTPIITFQIEQAAFRELIDFRKNNKEKKIIISSALSCASLHCLASAILFCVISIFIKNDYKYYLLIYVITSIFSSLLLQISRGLGNNKTFAKGGFVGAISSILFSVIFLTILHLRIDGLLLGSIIGQVISLIYTSFSLKVYKYISIKAIKIKTIKKLLRYSLPLVPNALSWWVFGSSDRFIVSILLGVSMNGILAAATKVSSIYTVLYNVFDRSWMESVSLHINDSDIEVFFNKAFNAILKVFIALLLSLIAAMPYLYKIFIDEKYIPGYNLVPFLLIAALFNVIQGLVVSVHAAKKDTKSIAKTSAAAAIINIVVHLGTIHYLGLYAAPVSTLCSYLVIAMYRFIDTSKKYFRIRIDKKLVIISMTSLCVVLSCYYYNRPLTNAISLIFGTSVSILLNISTINSIKKIAINKIKGVSNE